ncbi:MAG: ribosome biogenesis GTP-binding protein YihA/YsxC [Gammaproteobacteria bacterium]|nr:ribosome biogenesis GTP-binding protein YihA/YsxC [Gammaproteobacteria bacterium]
MTSKIHYNQATYLTSATSLAELPSDEGREIAFIGRSNAGKSSAINTIVNIKGLARTSTTPGRTQMINFFAINEMQRLVDLPGYGYAKAPIAMKMKWQQTTSDYFEKRESLEGLILVMDARHPLKDMDQQLITWCAEFHVRLHILLTKADKLTPNDQKKTLFTVQKALSGMDTVSVQLFSSLKKTGVDEARAKLDEWFVI